MKIFIIGETSYLAGECIAEWSKHGHIIYALQRMSVSQAVFHAQLGCVKLIDRTQCGSEVFDLVVNFSYVRSSKITSLAERNFCFWAEIEGLLNILKSHLYVQISTIAVNNHGTVFGRILGRCIPWSSDDYVAGKKYVEWRFARWGSRKGVRACVLRLGHIVGPGAPGYVCNIARCLVLGEACPGFVDAGVFNGTYSRNIASHLEHLAFNAPNEFEVYTQAELSTISWGGYLRRLCLLLNVNIKIDSSVGRPRRTVVQELRNCSRAFISILSASRLLRVLIRKLLDSRSSSSGRPILMKSRFSPYYLILNERTAVHQKFAPGWLPPYTVDDVMTVVGSDLNIRGF